jgi:hypothetical protein
MFRPVSGPKCLLIRMCPFALIKMYRVQIVLFGRCPCDLVRVFVEYLSVSGIVMRRPEGTVGVKTYLGK